MSARQIGVVGAVVTALLAFPLQSVAQPRAVVELFTSQGCSSCPTADDVLAGLSKDPSVIALSLPIDYWDYLGWKDTLADARHTKRQKGYSKVRGDRTVYTPQMIVNGVTQALGSDKVAVEQAMAQSRGNASVLSVPVKIVVGKDAVTVTTGAPAGDASSGYVWLCPISKTVTVQIGRGENRGRTVTYTNVVRGWIRLGEWSGAPASFKLAREEIPAEDADTVAVLVQSGTPERPGAMVGAALAGLK
jgi:hypothetical protein